jgi:hypothetical protein
MKLPAFVIKNLPTCKDVSQMVSDTMEQGLPLRERLGLHLHLWLCLACRRYVRHLRFLRRASRKAAAELPAKKTLGEDARERIAKRLGVRREE